MNKIIATILALLVLLPFASAAINAGTGAPPSEAERASSVQVLNFGNNAMICVNCPALTTEAEPGLDVAQYFPRIVCKSDTPCVIYTGLKYKGQYVEESSSENQPYAITSKDAYQKGRPLITPRGGGNKALEDVAEGETVLDAERRQVYTVENPHKIILKNAKAYIDNRPVGTEGWLTDVSEADAEKIEAIRATEEARGRVIKIRGLDKRAPNQLIGEFSIPLKKGDAIRFDGLFGDKEYSFEKPVLTIGRFTDKEDDSTAEDEDAGDWLDELDNKFLDSSKDRSELQICNQKFVNYYAGSGFELKANEGRCEITEYLLNTELFEEDDADDNKLAGYYCGDIAFEAVGGNAKRLYCNQEEIHNAILSCGKDGNDPVCTGRNGKTKMKIKLEPDAFEIDNTQVYNFRSIKEVTSEEQKAYHFTTGMLKIRTYQLTDTPNRHDSVAMGNAPGKEIIITYKDTTAMGTNTITLPEGAVVQRKRGAQLFSYSLTKADYKGILGEGRHQINLIYPEGLERNEETSTKISESRTRGATRDDIALLGAVAEEKIELSSPSTHLYTVTPMPVGQESAVEAQTITLQATAASATALGAYAYRHCFKAEPPASFTGAAKEATERIARAMLETNPQLTASEDILNTPIPAGTELNLPGTTTTYRYNPRQAEAEAAQSRGERITGLVRVRVNTQGCFGLSAPLIQGEQCLDKLGAVVKCVPKSQQSQCVNVYTSADTTNECIEDNVCCEIKLAQAGEYCVIPEEGAFMASGAKCKARCRSEVTATDYNRIGAENVERVTHCAEGLKCCKSPGSSRRSAPQAQTPAPIAEEETSASATCGPRDAWACKENCNSDGTETHSAGYDADCGTGKMCCRANIITADTERASSLPIPAQEE